MNECHNLDYKANGEARFAYVGQDPWHRLGTKMPAGATMDEMLEVAGAGFHVGLHKVIAWDEANNAPLKDHNGDYVFIDNSRGTVRDDGDGHYDGLATVGTRYNVAQNRLNLEKAMALVAASEQTDTPAHLETVGVLDQGRQFFACIDLGEANLLLTDDFDDPMQRYIGVRSSHDGTVPSSFNLNGVRWVCRNTVNAGLASATKSYRARHTKNGVDFSVEAALKVLGMENTWVKAVQEVATSLLRIELTDAQVDKAFKEMFSIPDDASKTVKANNDEIRTSIASIYASDRCKATFGPNGWSLYNAFGEYFDHHRSDDKDKMALTSLDDGSWVNKSKDKAASLILAMA